MNFNDSFEIHHVKTATTRCFCESLNEFKNIKEEISTLKSKMRVGNDERGLHQLKVEFEAKNNGIKGLVEELDSYKLALQLRMKEFGKANNPFPESSIVADPCSEKEYNVIADPCSEKENNVIADLCSEKENSVIADPCSEKRQKTSIDDPNHDACFVTVKRKKSSLKLRQLVSKIVFPPWLPHTWIFLMLESRSRVIFNC